ncbi:MAG: hypothetical protein LBM99_04180, partial [Bacillales bacterium]|nr:hypothetical protein [Bacillales bacterium]
GEIYDEHDVIPKDIVEIGNHIYNVDGGFLIEDLFDDYLEETPKPRTTIKTVGSWIKRLFDDNNASFDDSFVYDNIKITILDYDDKRKIINKVEIEEITDTSEE